VKGLTNLQDFYRQVFAYCILFEYKSEWGGGRAGSKENIWLKKEIGEYNDK
jgi:hypothetical protein